MSRLDRVADQVRHHLCDPIRVDQRVGPALDAQRDLLIGSAEAKLVDDSFADLVQIGGLELELEGLPRANPGEVEI